MLTWLNYYFSIYSGLTTDGNERAEDSNPAQDKPLDSPLDSVSGKDGECFPR